MPLNTPTTSYKEGTWSASADETIATPTAAGNNSTVFDARSYREKTFYFKNTSDRAIDIQVQGSPDQAFTEVFTVGAVISLAVGNVTATRDKGTLTDYHPFLRVNVKSTTTDSTVGSLTIFLRGQNERH